MTNSANPEQLATCVCKGRAYPGSGLGLTLTFTTVLAESADNKLIMFFLFYPEDRIWHFMQIVSWDNLQEVSNAVFWKNKKNISACCQLKFLPSILSIKYWDTDPGQISVT